MRWKATSAAAVLLGLALVGPVVLVPYRVLVQTADGEVRPWVGPDTRWKWCWQLEFSDQPGVTRVHREGPRPMQWVTVNGRRVQVSAPEPILWGGDVVRWPLVLLVQVPLVLVAGGLLTWAIRRDRRRRAEAAA